MFEFLQERHRDRLEYSSDSNVCFPKRLKVGNKCHLYAYSFIAYSHQFHSLHTENSHNRSAKLSQLWTLGSRGNVYTKWLANVLWEAFKSNLHLQARVCTNYTPGNQSAWQVEQSFILFALHFSFGEMRYRVKISTCVVFCLWLLVFAKMSYELIRITLCYVTCSAKWPHTVATSRVLGHPELFFSIPIPQHKRS